jgi:hypothetical protein
MRRCYVDAQEVKIMSEAKRFEGRGQDNEHGERAPSSPPPGPELAPLERRAIGQEKDEAGSFSWHAIVCVKGSRRGEGDLFVHHGAWMLDTDEGAIPAGAPMNIQAHRDRLRLMRPKGETGDMFPDRQEGGS